MEKEFKKILNRRKLDLVLTETITFLIELMCICAIITNFPIKDAFDVISTIVFCLLIIGNGFLFFSTYYSYKAWRKVFDWRIQAHGLLESEKYKQRLEKIEELENKLAQDIAKEMDEKYDKTK